MPECILHAWMHFSPHDIFFRGGWRHQQQQQLHSKLPQLLLTKADAFTPSSVHLALKKAERVKDQFHVISDGRGRIAQTQVVAIKRAL